MNILLALIILIATFSLVTSAPRDHIHEYELAMLNKLHKPWMTHDKSSVYRRREEYPRKGEYPCNGGICKPKVANDCEDCQFAKPLEIGEWETRK